MSSEVEDDTGLSGDRWNQLSKRLKSIYGWWCFLTDVENGGLSQFFYNNADRFTTELAELLTEAGCEGVAALIEEAVAVYREHQSEFDVTDPFGDDGLFETMTAFDKLNSKVVPLLTKAGKELEKFLRANAADFVTDEEGNAIDPTFSGNIEVKYPDGTVREQATVKKGKLTGA